MIKQFLNRLFQRQEVSNSEFVNDLHDSIRRRYKEIFTDSDEVGVIFTNGSRKWVAQIVGETAGWASQNVIKVNDVSELNAILRFVCKSHGHDFKPYDEAGYLNAEFVVFWQPKWDETQS